MKTCEMKRIKLQEYTKTRKRATTALFLTTNQNPPVDF